LLIDGSKKKNKNKYPEKNRFLFNTIVIIMPLKTHKNKLNMYIKIILLNLNKLRKARYSIPTGLTM
jgi:hypothetical protein